jgi:uncharacterized protein (TIGR01319 family)
MPTSLIDADSLMVIDVGSVTTRALLFDVVDSRYRFLAAGVAPSTAAAPYHDISEGVRQAIDHLQNLTGRTLVGSDERLIKPATGFGSGVDTFAATISAGALLKILVVGLLEDVSVESARHLAITIYGSLVETISLNDRRRSEARIDVILRLRPDLIVVAGGTDGGASQSVLKLFEPIRMACSMLPAGQRPEVLFVGNQALKERVQALMDGGSNIHFASNVRPTLEVEQLDAAQVQLAEIYTHIRAQRLPGVKELSEWGNRNLLPTASAFGRLIRFLSKAYASNKGVLGLDIGASATTLAAALNGELALRVYPELGLASGLSGLLERVRLADVTRWLPVDIADEVVRDYLFNRALSPASLPVTPEELAIEQGLTRQLMQMAVRQTAGVFPSGETQPNGGLLPWFEPIIATGSVLTRAPSLAHTLLMLLDGLQPTGTTTLVLDQNHLSSALGAAAAINPLLVAQVLDSNSYLYLGTVISPVGHARPGTPVLQLKITYENNHEASLDVNQGALEILPLPAGQTAHVHLQPLHRYDVGMGGPGRGGRLNIHGGVFGVIIDARGRPLQLPDDAGRRRELLKKWFWTLGG